MRKVFNKVLAGATATAMAATLLAGVGVTKTVNVKADGAVALQSWSFYQSGNMASGDIGVGNYTSVTLSSGEVLSEDAFNVDKGEQTVMSAQPADGFTATIGNTGWDAIWAVERFNPWQVRAGMFGIPMEAGHDYTITFKAHASKTKNAYVTLGSEFEGEPQMTSGDATIAIGTEDKTYTYTFTNWAGSTSFDFEFMLGAFTFTNDYAGNDLSSVIAVENNWNGTVYVSDFTVTDNGKNPEATEAPTKVTAAPTEATTAPQLTAVPDDPTTAAPVKKKLGKVTGIKGTSKKKKTVTVTWKKVTNAKSYQIKVGKRTYTSTKTKKVVKKLTSGKKVAIKVRALAPGYTTGAWGKGKKVKVK